LGVGTKFGFDQKKSWKTSFGEINQDSNSLYYKCFTIVIYKCKGRLQFAAYFTIIINAPN
jgi:hypothetical protein